jgi:hypothetical protein
MNPANAAIAGLAGIATGALWLLGRSERRARVAAMRRESEKTPVMRLVEQQLGVRFEPWQSASLANRAAELAKIYEDAGYEDPDWRTVAVVDYETGPWNTATWLKAQQHATILPAPPPIGGDHAQPR